jgi:hypothetical protein
MAALVSADMQTFGVKLLADIQELLRVRNIRQRVVIPSVALLPERHHDVTWACCLDNP